MHRPKSAKRDATYKDMTEKACSIPIYAEEYRGNAGSKEH